MKKILLFSAVACSIVLYACTKDSSTQTTTIDPLDRDELATAVEVGYSTSVSGTLPSASIVAGAPVLTDPDNQTIECISNRYIVIHPQTASGSVSGYYLQISGASKYYTIDYTLAKSLRKATNKSISFLRDGDNADSAIVIKLPEHLKGDTFSVKYAAYDSLKHASNSIHAIIKVTAPNTEDNKTFVGTWKYNRFQEGTDTTWHHYSYTSDSIFSHYICDGNKLLTCTKDTGCLTIASSISLNQTNELIFTEKNGLLRSSSSKYMKLNLDSSACNMPKYSTKTGGENVKYGFAYDPTTKILTIIVDGNGDANQVKEMYTTKITISEVSSTKLVLVMNDGRYKQEFIKK